MALLPTGWIKMPGDNDETKRFAWSHVKSIFYNKAANILLKDKLDEMDKIIDEKIAKALMSNVQVNDQGKIPTSALAYAMQQSITKNGQDIAKLNSDLAVSFYDIPQPADNDIFTFDTWEFRCLRSGNIVTLKINIGGNMKAISDFIDLLTLDSKYKPFNYNIIHNYVTQQGKPMILNILANGTVRLWNMNTSISDGWICRQCITYVTNS